MVFRFLGDEIVVMSEVERNIGDCGKFNFFHQARYKDVEHDNGSLEYRPFFPDIQNITNDMKINGISVNMEGTLTDGIIEELEVYKVDNRDYWGLVADSMIRHLRDVRDTRGVVVDSYISSKVQKLPDHIVVDDFFNSNTT